MEEAKVVTFLKVKTAQGDDLHITMRGDDEGIILALIEYVAMMRSKGYFQFPDFPQPSPQPQPPQTVQPKPSPPPAQTTPPPPPKDNGTGETEEIDVVKLRRIVSKTGADILVVFASDNAEFFYYDKNHPSHWVQWPLRTDFSPPDGMKRARVDVEKKRVLSFI
jgi:hypothetical protein